MATNFGWAFIDGTSVLGDNDGVLVKVSGTQMKAYSDFKWDNTNKKLTIVGSSATSTALALTGKVEADNMTVSSDLTVSSDISVGAEGRTLATDSGFGNGNQTIISSTEVIPASYRGFVYGDMEIATGATLVVETGAVVAMQDLPSALKTN